MSDRAAVSVIETIRSGPVLDAIGAAGATHVLIQRVEVDGTEYQFIRAREPYPHALGYPDPRWHISVSGRDTEPTWRAFVAIVHHARPGVVFCQAIPPPQQWLNVNPYVWHAFEVRDVTLTNQWRAEGGRGLPLLGRLNRRLRRRGPQEAD